MVTYSETSDAFKSELLGGNKIGDMIGQLREVMIESPKVRSEFQKRLIVTAILFIVFWQLDYNLKEEVNRCEEEEDESECKGHKWWFALKIIFGLQLIFSVIFFYSLLDKSDDIGLPNKLPESSKL